MHKRSGEEMRMHFAEKIISEYILYGDLGVTTGKRDPEYMKEVQKARGRDNTKEGEGKGHEHIHNDLCQVQCRKIRRTLVYVRLPQRSDCSGAREREGTDKQGADADRLMGSPDSPRKKGDAGERGVDGIMNKMAKERKKTLKIPSREVVAWQWFLSQIGLHYFGSFIKISVYFLIYLYIY